MYYMLAKDALIVVVSLDLRLESSCAKGVDSVHVITESQGKAKESTQGSQQRKKNRAGFEPSLHG